MLIEMSKKKKKMEQHRFCPFFISIFPPQPFVYTLLFYSGFRSVLFRVFI